MNISKHIILLQFRGYWQSGVDARRKYNIFPQNTIYTVSTNKDNWWVMKSHRNGEKYVWCIKHMSFCHGNECHLGLRQSVSQCLIKNSIYDIIISFVEIILLKK